MNFLSWPLVLATAATLGAVDPPALPPTEDSNSRPTSLIAGEWVRGSFLRWGTCPDPEVICHHAVYDWRLRRIRTLSGPRIRSTVSVRAVTSFRPPRRGQPVVMLVHQPVDGSAHWLGLVLNEKVGDDYCLSAQQVAGFQIRPPRRSYEVGNMVCFPV